MTYEDQWQKKADTLIRDTFRSASSPGGPDIFLNYLTRLKILVTADITILLRQADTATVKAEYALPDYLADMTPAVTEYVQVLEAAGNAPLYYPDLAQSRAPFTALFTAMYSGLVLPVPHKKESAMLVLGWSGQQDFTPSFRSFMDLAKDRLRELWHNHYFRKRTLADIELMAAVFNVLPQGLIFFDNNGYTCWVNKEAAHLLQLSLYGEQSAPLIANVLQQLRSEADNREEIEQKVKEIFNSTDTVVNQWLWRFSNARPFQKLCVTTRPVAQRGRLWIFEDITTV